MDSQVSKKSFWEKPEGKTGGVFMFLIIAGLALAAYKIIVNIDYLLTLLQNLYIAGAMLLGIGTILYLAFDPAFRNNIWTIYKLMMKSMTGLIVNYDYIAIQEMHIKTLIDKRAEMDEHLTSLNGSKEALTNDVNSYMKQKKDALELARQAQIQLATNPHMNNQFVYQTSQVGLFDQAAKDIVPTLQSVTFLYDRLSKLYDDSEWLIKTLQSQVSVNKKKAAALRASTDTIKAAGKFFGDHDAEQDMFDQSMEAMADDFANRAGAVNRYLQNTISISDSIDLQKGVISDKGTQMLADYQNEDYTTVFDISTLNLDKTSIGSISPDKILIPNNPAAVQKSLNSYDDL